MNFNHRFVVVFYFRVICRVAIVEILNRICTQVY